MLKDRHIYPALFTYAQDGITVEFPDLPGCISEGDSEEEALSMARDSLALRLYTMERDNQSIPAPSNAVGIQVSENQVIILVDVWMPPFRQSIRERAVRKTVTIPRWLDDLARSEGVNFSLILQRGLKDCLGVVETVHPAGEPAIYDAPTCYGARTNAKGFEFAGSKTGAATKRGRVAPVRSQPDSKPETQK